MRCGACGAEVSDRARYCTACGAALDAPAAAADDRTPLPGGPFDPSPGPGGPFVYAGVLVPPDPGPRRRSPARVLFGLAVVAALVGGGLLLYRSIVLEDDEGRAALPSLRSVGADSAWARRPSQTLTVGDEEQVAVRSGAAVADVEVAAPTELRVLVDAGARAAVVPAEDGRASRPAGAALEPVDGVVSLAAGRYRVLVVPPDPDADEAAVTVRAVPRDELPADDALAGSLTDQDPVLDVLVAPGQDHAWNLVDRGSPGVTAEVRDVSAGGTFADGEPVCDQTDVACDLVAGSEYVVRLRADGAADYDLRFEDRPPTGGPGSVTFDGRDAPRTGIVAAQRTVSYHLVVGPPEGVVVTVTPVGAWDPDVKLDGARVSTAGPGAPEVIEVEAGTRHTFTVGGGQLGGGYRITVARR